MTRETTVWTSLLVSGLLLLTYQSTMTKRGVGQQFVVSKEIVGQFDPVTRQINPVKDVETADPALIRNDSEMTAAVFYLGHVYESLGVLVFHRILPLHLVDDLMGGYLRQSFAKLRPYMESRRQELGVSYAEWMEWLAERLIAHPSPGKSKGAHIAHRDWRP